MSDYIQKLIEKGEHQQLDFKFEISDSKKIARSLVAFANTDGGKLLVGVKDNGVVAGVRSEEEYHMVEAAAQLYCRPEVTFKTREWVVQGRKVLEVVVPKNPAIKHKAPDKNGEYRFFVRVHDQNILADSILIKLWKKESENVPVKIFLAEAELGLLRYLEKQASITVVEFMKLFSISKPKAEIILVNFIRLGIIDMIMTEKGTKFALSDTDYQSILEEHNCYDER